MSRRGESGVRGPNSALTEFLRSRGISAQEIIRRHAERTEAATTQEHSPRRGIQQNLTVPPNPSSTVSTSSPRRIAITRRAAAAAAAAQAEIAAAAVAVAASASISLPSKKSNKRKKPGSDDEDHVEFNPYRNSKPLPGQICFCEECNCRFTVTPYSKPGPDGEGLLCNACGKKTANLEKDAKRKKYTIKNNRRQKNVALLDGESLGVKSLTDLCIQVVAKHINDVDALGDIGVQNMEKICQIISRNRSLNNDTINLFLDPGSTKLNLYDCSKIEAEQFHSIAAIVPTLRYLNLKFCGSITDDVIQYYSTQLTDLRGLSLGGPFLVTKSCYADFFLSRGSQLETFELTDTFRFDAETVCSLVDLCPNLTELRLRTVTRIDDECVQMLTGLSNLKVLEISEPEQEITDDSIIELLNSVGSGLKELNLNRCYLLTDRTLHAIKACCPNLVSLSLEELELVTDKGVANLFNGWNINPGLQNINFSRIINLTERGMFAMLKHSGKTVETLNLNSCKIEATVWETLDHNREDFAMPKLLSLDIGFVRSVNDEVVEMLLGTDEQKAVAPELRQMNVWGNYRITEKVRCPDKFRLVGREADLH